VKVGRKINRYIKGESVAKKKALIKSLKVIKKTEKSSTLGERSEPQNRVI